MTPENFVAWLNGFISLSKTTPTPEQWLIIKDHLQEVFNKVTPNRNMYIGHSFSDSLKHEQYPNIEGLKNKLYPSGTITKSWADKDFVYLTLTDNPYWQNNSYAFYPEAEGLKEKLEESFDLKINKIRFVVDNSLKPQKETYAPDLKPNQYNHLVGLPKGNMGGLVNIGQGEPLIC